MKTIKLMADYQCHPLWDMTPQQYGDINPEALPISQNLKQQLAQWARSYDETLNKVDPASSGFENAEREAEFVKAGYELAERLQHELGPDFTITIKIKS